MKSTSREFILFIVLGGINSILTYLLYALFLLLTDYVIAYTLSYVAGIVLSYYLNSRFVFRQTMQVKKAAQYPVVYLVQYLLSVLSLRGLVDWFGLDPLLAPWLVIGLTIPPTFLLSRWIIRPHATRG